MNIYVYALVLSSLVLSGDLLAISKGKSKLCKAEHYIDEQGDNGHAQVKDEAKIDYLYKYIEDSGGANGIDTLVTQQGQTALSSIWQDLDELGIHANTKDDHKFTALMYVVKINCHSLTNIFLSQEAVDVLAQDDEGKSALSYAQANKLLFSKDTSEAGKYSIALNKAIIDMLEKAANNQRRLNAQVEEQLSIKAKHKNHE